MRYFKIEDFACKETGENQMDEHFLLWLDELRHRCGFAFNLTSAYRSPRHSVEVVKDRPGQHAQGRAVDIRVSGGAQRYILMREAFKMGFTGIGEHKNFIHVDMRITEPKAWPY